MEENHNNEHSMEATTHQQAQENRTTCFKTCQKNKDHGEYEARVTTIMDGREIYSMCPKCESEEKDRKARELKYRADTAKKDQIRAAGVPVRYRSYDIGSIVPSNDNQAEIINRCKKYAENFLAIKKLGTSLVFTGMPGTGKTLIAMSMVKEIVGVCVDAEIQKSDTVTFSCDRAVICLYANVYDFFTEVKSTYRKDSLDTEVDILRHYTSPYLLILDEIGVQNGTDYEANMLFRIINKRYEDMKPTILISNLSEEALTEYIGHRTIDRFRENHGAVFVFNWGSARK